jgi:hypothetical protein
MALRRLCLGCNLFAQMGALSTTAVLSTGSISTTVLRPTAIILEDLAPLPTAPRVEEPAFMTTTPLLESTWLRPTGSLATSRIAPGRRISSPSCNRARTSCSAEGCGGMRMRRISRETKIPINPPVPTDSHPLPAAVLHHCYRW